MGRNLTGAHDGLILESKNIVLNGKKKGSGPAIYAYTKALLGENCLSSNSCHFVKNYFFLNKLLHAYVQYVYIVTAKYQIVPSKAVV